MKSEEKSGAQEDKGIRSEARVVVERPVAELFEFWRALENFPRFMTHVEEVKRLEGGTYRWRVRAPLGTTIAWEARVTDVQQNSRIAWASEPGSPLTNRGEVRFSPRGAGTEVHVVVTYEPPLGAVGHAAATLLGVNPGQQMSDDLGRLKSLLEAGRALADGKVVEAGEVRHDEASRRKL